MTKLNAPLFLKSLPLMAVTAMLFGCAAGPDFKRPEAPKATTYSPQGLPTATQQGDTQQFSTTQNIDADWWNVFQSPAINSLITRAFKNNSSIESAQAALKQSQESVLAQQGFFYPSVGVSYAASRNKLAGNMGGNSPGLQADGTLIQTYSNPTGPTFNGPAYYNFHTSQLSINYVPDLFGLNRRQVESLQAQTEAQRMQLAATYITLASNVVAAALQEASLRAQLLAVKKFVGANQEMLTILQKQFELGFVSKLDVANQASLLAQSEQSLPPLQKQLDQTRNLIRALAGNTPDQEVNETFELKDIHLPQNLPLSLPSQIIEQRPDVRAAEAQLHAATALYGVAIANRLPQFSITGAIGGMATNPGWMYEAGGQFFNLSTNVAQTIFDGGTLKAKSRAAQQAVVQAAADYRSTVIAALQNVADTLAAIQSDTDLLKSAATAESASAIVLELTRLQYQQGFVSYQALLLAEQNYQLTALTLAQAQVARLGDTAALYQALGGGWWQKENTDLALAEPKSTPNLTANHSSQHQEKHDTN